MKILFIGSTRGDRCSLYYFTNFVKTGATVIPFDPHFFDPRSLSERLQIRLRRGPVPSRVYEVSDFLVSTCRQNQFDVVFVMAENFVTAQTIHEMRNQSGYPPTFIYHSHDNNFAPGICKPSDFAETIKAYDAVFTTKSQNVARYRELGQPNSYFIPSAYESTTHRPIRGTESVFGDRLFDVSFIGTYDHSRIKFMDAAGWDRLHIWGDNWRRAPQFSQYHDRITPRAIYYFEFSDVISHSKCNLGLLREEAEDLHTQRTFEIPACGGLQFAPRNEEIQTFFTDKKEFVGYSSPEELKDLLTYYLSHEKERAAIAQAGYQRVTSGHHSYLDRVEQMLRTATATIEPRSIGAALGSSSRQSAGRRL